MPAPFAIPKDMKMMKLREKALKLRYLYSAQHISWARRITQPTLQWWGYAFQCRNMFGSMQKGQVQEVICRVTQVLRWFWTQWKRILLYKQNLEAFALNSSVLKYLTWNLEGICREFVSGMCLSKSEALRGNKQPSWFGSLLWFEHPQPANTLPEFNILWLSASLSTEELLRASLPWIHICEQDSSSWLHKHINSV